MLYYLGKNSILANNPCDILYLLVPPTGHVPFRCELVNCKRKTFCLEKWVSWWEAVTGFKSIDFGGPGGSLLTTFTTSHF